MEGFVPYELAVKLKEKGFNEVCYNYYEPLKHFLNPLKVPWTNKDCESYGVITTPTISQVLKWLREEKDIDLVISPVFFYDDVLGKIREYGCKVFTPSLNKPAHCGYHKKWELAALAGINYIIDNNLI